MDSAHTLNTYILLCKDDSCIYTITTTQFGVYKICRGRSTCTQYTKGFWSTRAPLLKSILLLHSILGKSTLWLLALLLLRTATNFAVKGVVAHWARSCKSWYHQASQLSVFESDSRHTTSRQASVVLVVSIRLFLLFGSS